VLTRLNRNLTSTLHSLFKTASSREVRTSHSLSAITALCCILQSRKGSADLKTLLWERGQWLNYFNLYLLKAESVRAKSVRSLLSVLISFLKDNDDSEVLKRALVRQLLHPIFVKSERPRVKASFSAFAHLLSKGALTVEDVLSNSDFFNEDSTYFKAKTLLLRLLEWAVLHELAAAAGHAVVAFWRLIRCDAGFQKAVQLHKPRVSPATAWIEPMLLVLNRDLDALTRFKSHVFPQLFRLDTQDYFLFLKVLHVRSELSLTAHRGTPLSDTKRKILFAALQAGNEAAILYDSGSIKGDLHITTMADFVQSNLVTTEYS